MNTALTAADLRFLRDKASEAAAMLRTLGQPAGQPRLPLGPTPDGLEDQARAVYAALMAEPIATESETKQLGADA